MYQALIGRTRCPEFAAATPVELSKPTYIVGGIMKKKQNINRKQEPEQEQKKEKERQDDILDEALEDTFPASDPPSSTSPVVRKDPPARHKRKSNYQSYPGSSTWNVH
jgi:hypothetical protein